MFEAASVAFSIALQGFRPRFLDVIAFNSC